MDFVWFRTHSRLNGWGAGSFKDLELEKKSRALRRNDDGRDSSPPPPPPFRPTFPQLELQTRYQPPPSTLFNPLVLLCWFLFSILAIWQKRDRDKSREFSKHDAGRPPSISPFPHHTYPPRFLQLFFFLSPPLPPPPRAQLTRICKSSAEITPQPDQKGTHTHTTRYTDKRALPPCSQLCGGHLKSLSLAAAPPPLGLAFYPPCLDAVSPFHYGRCHSRRRLAGVSLPQTRLAWPVTICPPEATGSAVNSRFFSSLALPLPFPTRHPVER